MLHSKLIDIIIYQDNRGREPVTTWLESFKDKTIARRIRNRIENLSLGLAGDSKSLGAGLFELRFQFGPGYRLYYAKDGEKIIVLLCGGDKGTQKKDIEKARGFYEDYKEKNSA